jgi:uncharacterized OB-fold protein
MSYLPLDTPVPAPERWEAAFWEFCAQRRLRFQCCARCGYVRHPPLPCCPRCNSFGIGWVDAPDDAELYTYTIVHHPSHETLARAVPYNAAVVAFPSLGYVRLVSNIVHCPPEALRIGMPLRLVWEVTASDRVLPRFEPRHTSIPS